MGAPAAPSDVLKARIDNHEWDGQDGFFINKRRPGLLRYLHLPVKPFR